MTQSRTASSPSRLPRRALDSTVSIAPTVANRFTQSVAIIMIASVMGCTTVGPNGEVIKKPKSSLAEKMPWAKKKDAVPEPYPNPVKMAATWTPDTLVQTNRTPTRGFGGRIFFYDEKSRAVPVDGTLVVHGFDEQAESADQATKRFEFTPEQFTRHFSQSDLGASYSVWVPWDAVGGDVRRISLVASFRTEAGVTVQGVPATVMLPGKESAETALAKAETKLSPQYQEYRKAAASISTQTSGLTTTTIQRRGRNTPSQSIEPSPSPIPSAQLVEGRSTPSAEIKMSKRDSQSDIRPASVSLPLQ
ncbi:hypothetical protein Pla52o_49230 [Novipirellula galeiformis]|uniref:Uncharacterized protein n=1 Tax=Novipirellula galeiformis TaxID=2528004 RepID=A0A5C6C0N8_9BACT|nr:hypothetical protein [Novipirellula galeiformis]TWU17708.1 hypothetical protein Pla52o_49230 [Novipirellula galeiformis]